MPKPTTVLVVEDEFLIAADLEQQLTDLGYQVLASLNSAEEAVQQAEGLAPDLILMDIGLAGPMDGIAAAEEIRARLDLPVVYLTANTDTETLNRAKASQPFGYLLKPFTGLDLQATIELALAKHRLEVALRQSEEKYRTLFEKMLNGFAVKALIYDAEGKLYDYRFIEVNPAFGALTGLNRETLLGHTAREVMPGLLEQHWLDAYDQVAKSGIPTYFENHARELGRYYEVVVYPAGPNQVAIVFSDITERRQIEAQLRQRNRKLDLLNRIITSSVRALEPAELLQTVCWELAAAFDLLQAAALLFNETKTEVAVIAGTWTDEKGAVISDRTVRVENLPLAQQMLTLRAPMVAVEADRDPRLTGLADLLGSDRIASMLAPPLVIESEAVGFLILYASQTYPFSTDDINLAWSVAEQTAGVLAHTRLTQIQKRLSAAIDQTSDTVIITDTGGRITYVNPAFERISGYSRTEVIGQNPRLLKSGQQSAAFYQELWATIRAGRVWRGRLINKKKDGTLYTEDATISPIQDRQRTIVNYVAVKRDISRELRLEEQFHQAQKMDAVGRLAGGVAHDFNNLLTVINGYSSVLLRGELPDPEILRHFIEQIHQAGERAANLTRQLLAFSCKQVLKPEILDLNQIVTDMHRLLKRLIGETISLIIRLHPTPVMTKVDRGQLEQVIMNLAVNARDAMPGGGQLIFETSPIYLAESYTQHYVDVIPGNYILLLVSDTGTGIEPVNLNRIFEPFFTTKAAGKGTGLGLATVHGIIKQSGGHIEVDSVVGAGTSFKIYLPQSHGPDQPSTPDQTSSDLPRGNETILVAEDDHWVRQIAVSILRNQGYNVLIAADGTDALRLNEMYPETIDLLLTDVVMPDLNGQELAKRLRNLRPALKVIFMSGYTQDDPALQEILSMENVAYLRKPFTQEPLSRMIRHILDGLTFD